MSATADPKPSALGRLLGRAAHVEPRESQAVVAAFLLLFFVLGGYAAVKPVRETIGTILGADRVSDLYGFTWAATILIVPLYGALCARFRRSVFLPWIYGFVAFSLALVGIVLAMDQANHAVAEFFYVWISVLSLFIVSVFWSFLLELYDAGQTQRLFGVIAAGGTTGALVGPLLTDLVVPFIGNPGVLMMGAVFFVIAIVLQRALLRVWAGIPTAGGAPRADDRPMGGNPFAGVSLVLKSPYLLGIALFVILLASVNTFLYLEQLRLVAETFPDREQRTQVFARLDYIVQGLTVLLQLFVTGRIASRLGVVALVTIVPVVMVAGFLGLAVFNTFWVLAIVYVTRRVGEYSFIRPGREMLFSRVSTETKYKAKNLIDVPVYRGGDFLSAQVKTALESGGLGATGIAIMGAVLAGAWAVNGWWLGRHQEAGGTQPPPTPGH